ncbi:MAG: class I SAM-dependent methyltransferase, partial [Firmicutes bacterium]|nr:class I SAM-dependent methyltransferase [Bacillota bacterium]
MSLITKLRKKLSDSNFLRRVPISILTNFKDLDEFVSQFKNNPDLEFLARYKLDENAFFDMFGSKNNNPDPFSAEYRDYEFKFFEFLAGNKYNVSDEGEKLGRDSSTLYATNPLVHMSESYRVERLNKVIDFASFIGMRQGEKILEMGCGYGFLASTLEAWGADYWGIDASEIFIDCSRRMVFSDKTKKQIVHSQFADFENLGQKFDTVIFESAFHHCSDPVGLLQKIHTNHRGRVILWNEPILESADRPWGIIRYDGETMLQIRSRGWLELAWTRDFLYELFRKTGWMVKREDRSRNFVEIIKQ